MNVSITLILAEPILRTNNIQTYLYNTMLHLLMFRSKWSLEGLATTTKR